MAKKRLNKTHKLALKNLAKKIVDIDEVRKKTEHAHQIANQKFLTEIAKIYPAQEMAILEKHESVVEVIEIRFLATNAKEVYHDCHSLCQAIKIPKPHRYGSKLQIDVDSETYKAHQAHKKAKDEYRKKTKCKTV